MLLVNSIENGLIPVHPPVELHQLGYSIAASTLTLLQAIVSAVKDALNCLGKGEQPTGLKSFEAVRDTIGFNE